ncbi:MAG: hypothetical protein JWM96_1422, partial [Alphaproteobacteria bacterium]|nr:hypothetical protein [Alphaproteobacteria bacterium]
IGKQIATTPILEQDLLIFGTFDGTLEAVAAADGREIWSLKLPDTVFSLASDGEGTIYAGTGLHDSKTALMNAVQSSTGRIIWQREFTGHIEEPPGVDAKQHRLFVGAGPGSLWALDTRSGDVLWHKDIGHLDGTPLLYGNALYIPAQKSEALHESFFYALNPLNGETLWKLDQPGQPWASPTIEKAGRVILTTTGEGQIGRHAPGDKGWAQAVSTEGKTLWQRVLPDMALTPNIYLPENDLMIYAAKNGMVTALKVADGSVTWETKIAGGFSAEGVLLEGFKEKVIAVMSEDGTLYLIDALTGETILHRKMGRGGYSAPLAIGGLLYVTTRHNITALSENRE